MKKRLKRNAGKAVGFLAGKGFYIVLFLCVAALGISGYLMFFTENTDPGLTADETINLPQIDLDTSEDTITTYNPTETDDSDETAPVFSETEIDVDSVTDVPETNDSDTSTEENPDTSETENSADTAEISGFVWPVTGEFLNEFSDDTLVFNSTTGDWRTHPGIDITSNVGSVVMAAAYGTVKEVYNDDLFGTTIVIDHGGGLCSRYSNLAESPTVSVGEEVSCGQVIGAVGVTTLVEINSAPHLHFEMLSNDIPVDPAEYLPTLN